MTTTLTLSDAVRSAAARGAPLVALETALLTHGLPAPANLETFRAMEEAVFDAGAVPAAVALLGGRLRVGLAPAEAAALGGGGAAHKAGLADLPALAAAGADAGTTVAATLWAAVQAGIDVFATGGIGGVHRGAETSFDVSGDLAALARFPGCVVCSGAKAVLDLPRTVELLETLGVCVVGFGVDRLPAFLARDSGVALRHRVDDVGAAAAVVRARDALGLAGAVLVVNPPPAEAALAAEPLEGAVQAALATVAAEGAAGPAVTPRLLAELGRRTGGDSIAANRALLVANARLAGRLAVFLADTPAPGERPFGPPARG